MAGKQAPSVVKLRASDYDDSKFIGSWKNETIAAKRWMPDVLAQTVACAWNCPGNREQEQR
jgi:hypothetical protein